MSWPPGWRDLSKEMREWQETMFDDFAAKLKLLEILHTQMRRRYNQKIHVFPLPAAAYAPEWLDTMRRVGGEALCRICRRPYNAHPNHPDYPEIHTLVVTCLGKLVKT